MVPGRAPNPGRSGGPTTYNRGMATPHSAALLAFAADVTRRIDAGPVAARVAPATLRRRLAGRFDLEAGAPPEVVLREIEDALRRFAVHVTHPSYFGLFNPSVLPEAVAAAALVAAFNPQEAVWSHSPGSQELERMALRRMASLAGLDPDTAAAHFTSGGQEANLTAVAAALAGAFPEWREHGVRALPGDPLLYVSAEAHHSLAKAARVCGLGDRAVRVVPTDAGFRMDVAALRSAIADDRAAGRVPVLVAGTAGTTSTGTIDPLPEIADVCASEDIWFHCDAAWGGGALLSPRLRAHLAGVERADSVTWDAHKWLSCPMGSGAFLCRRPDAVRAAFEVLSGYMPASRAGADDPHRVSLQWSRRAAGVPVLAALATRGAAGYAALVEHQAATGALLRDRLNAAGFEIVNDTPLPLVCFRHARMTDPAATARDVVAAGRAWISAVTLPDGARVLRACVTSYRTGEDEVSALVEAVTRAMR